MEEFVCMSHNGVQKSVTSLVPAVFLSDHLSDQANHVLKNWVRILQWNQLYISILSVRIRIAFSVRTSGSETKGIAGKILPHELPGIYISLET